MNTCELSFLDRVEIDIGKARRQHQAYTHALATMGLDIIELPEEPHLPDSVFVEDPAIVLDEIAVMTRPGAESRRPEGASLATALAHFRPLQQITAPGTLEGGDVMRVGRTLYAGASARSSRDGIAQLASILQPFDYEVRAVQVNGCLHLKSGCTYLGDGVVLANREWVDTSALEGLKIVDVAAEEPFAANVLTFEGAALMPEGFPETAKKVSSLGWKLQCVDISELRKAEAGVTCSSLIFRAN